MFWQPFGWQRRPASQNQLPSRPPAASVSFLKKRRTIIHHAILWFCIIVRDLWFDSSIELIEQNAAAL